jgi:conjugal transfer pilus assembly protein TraD
VHPVSLRKYEMPWRAPYELIAAVAWCGGGVLLVAFAAHAGRAFAVPIAFGTVSLVMAIYRGAQALRLLRLRVALAGRAMETLSPLDFRSYCRDPNQLFLGFGFEWHPVHSQRLYELAKVRFDRFLAPAWLRGALGRHRAPQPDAEVGLPYIHGVEPNERALHRPLQNFEGGTIIVGTTQSGKGVTLSVLAAQAIYRGDAVIVIDPKNSRRLKGNILRACRDAGRDEAFVEFHPAFPERGIRFDPLFNWQKPTELASRIQAVLPPDTTGSFSAFGWDAVNVVVQGLVELEDRPSLSKLSRCIEGGIEPILLRSLERLLGAVGPPDWRESARPYIKRAAEGRFRRPSPAASDELLGYIAYYERELAPQCRSKVIDAQLRIFHHPREHYQKITANLLPILSMLTSGDLGRSLSPDPFDPEDPRPILNLAKIVGARRVFYVALDSLPDPAVGTALGAILLADLAALAGIRYNLDAARPRISLFVDETADVINQPLIQILNKGAESGIYTTCAMQTLADLADRLGNEQAARRAVGNLNNLIALRSKDRPTQDFIVETFGRTAIHSVELSIGSQARAGWPVFSGSLSRRLRETREETIPPDILGKLPNLQYFALVSGGRLLKGRVPILAADAEDKPGGAAPTAR